MSLNTVKIPVPDLKTQKQIVIQIEKEQKAIEASKELIIIYKQKIKNKISEVWDKR